MAWESGELRKIKVKVKPRKGSKLVSQVKRVPTPYDRIIAQLLSEVQHAKNNDAHEALHQQTYAEEVLDNFYDEIIRYVGAPTVFHSKVLTPILQQQLLGVVEDYAAVVEAAVRYTEETLTIKAATEFYLQFNPTTGYITPFFQLI